LWEPFVTGQRILPFWSKAYPFCQGKLPFALEAPFWALSSIQIIGFNGKLILALKMPIKGIDHAKLAMPSFSGSMVQLCQIYEHGEKPSLLMRH
jgi:hypothetical protein